MDNKFSSVQFICSVVSDSSRPIGPQHSRPPCPSPTPRVYTTHFHWAGDVIQPSHPLLSPYPPALNLSQHQGLFKCVSSSHQVAKVLEFQLQYQSFQWTLGLISFRMGWFDLLAVQRTLKNLLQHHSSKASILQHSVFFIVQILHPYMTTGKTIALTRQTFVGKAMSLLFNMLYRRRQWHPTTVLLPGKSHRWQTTRLPYPWDSPGKNTGVGCHFILQCMKVKSESEVA